MQKIVRLITLIMLSAVVSACSFMSANQPIATAQPAANAEVAADGANEQPVELNQPGNEPTDIPVGGDLENSMDNNDKLKLSRALDKATGKATTWTGAHGIVYTITPVRKVTVAGRPFCREYSMRAARGGQVREATGTACITADGNWHAINN